MNKTEKELFNTLQKSFENAQALIRKNSEDHENEIRALKSKLKNQDEEELADAEKPEFLTEMDGNLIKVLYNCFQITKPKKQHGVVNQHRLAVFMKTSPQNLYNLQNGKGRDGNRRAYHLLFLMAQKLSRDDMRDVLRAVRAGEEGI